jgi:hypothetical protein
MLPVGGGLSPDACGAPYWKLGARVHVLGARGQAAQKDRSQRVRAKLTGILASARLI